MHCSVGKGVTEERKQIRSSSVQQVAAASSGSRATCRVAAETEGFASGAEEAFENGTGLELQS